MCSSDLVRDLELLSVRRCHSRLSLLREVLGTKVGLKLRPLMLRVAQGCEERRLEPAYGMGGREEVVAEPCGVDRGTPGVGKLHGPARSPLNSLRLKYG